MAIITIVGSGMMGSALAFPARENGHEVRLVGTHLDREIIEACLKTNRHPKFERDFPEGVSFHQIEALEGALEGADLVIGGVSSFGVEWFKDFVLPRIADGTDVLTVTKGLMDLPDGKLVTYPALWQKKLDETGKSLNLCAVGGPCTSYELVAHDQTEVCFCGANSDALRRVKKLMATDYYHISLSNDITGIESAVALKNGYALAVALTVGLNQRAFGIDSPLHFNSQAAVFYQAVREMGSLLKLQGAGTLDNLAVGAGDLYVTVYGGRTRLVGVLLGRGLDIDEAKAELKGVTLESLVVAERVARAVRIKAEKGEAEISAYPLLMHADDILTKHAPVDIPWEKFTFENLC
ncbi:MAG: glycerol-3-phosphate dehydrogenase [Clostridia bacterium]|nr:glycerol-3-phosphate dehydrogenase [Clostridia bacterium]